MIKIYNMEVMKALKQMLDESVDMQICSPPYWGLRNYSKETEISWDGDKNCKHDFEMKERRLHGGSAKNTVHGAILAGGLEVDWKTKDGFCSKCGAWKGQLGLEPNFDLYIKHLCDIFDEVKRVLKKDGTCWINLGDTYNSHSAKSKNVGGFEGKQMKKNEEYSKSKIVLKKEGVPDKCLVMIPFRFAIEMVNRGWVLRNTIIWYKPGCMPSSAKDRFTVDFEYLFFFSKNKKYFFNQQLEPVKTETIQRNKYGHRGDGVTAIGRKRKPGEFATKQGEELLRNKRCVWEINTDSSKRHLKGVHFAIFPKKLIETPIKTTKENAIIMDIFVGSGTTLEVARELGRDSIGIEINPKYVELCKKRLMFDKKGNRNLYPEPEVIHGKHNNSG